MYATLQMFQLGDLYKLEIAKPLFNWYRKEKPPVLQLFCQKFIKFSRKLPEKQAMKIFYIYTLILI